MRIKRTLLLAVFLFAVVQIALAQPGDPSSDPDVPITGIEILIGGGLALGIRRFLKKKKIG